MDNFFGSMLLNCNSQLRVTRHNESMWEEITRELKEKHCYLATEGYAQSEEPSIYCLPDGQKVRVYHEQRTKTPEALFFHGIGLNKAIAKAVTGYSLYHAEESFSRLRKMNWDKTL